MGGFAGVAEVECLHQPPVWRTNYGAGIMARSRIKTLKAIHPNVGVEDWYQRELDALLREAHADLVAMVQTSASIALAQDCVTRRTLPFAAVDAASPNMRLNAALKKWGDKWSRKFDKAADRIAKQFATKSFTAFQSSMRSELAKANFTVRFAPTRASLAAFQATVSENVALIKSIQQQYHTKIQGDVWRAVTRGSDLSKLSTDLRSTYGVSVKRAALIARDQNAKAKATIENTRRQELGITQAIWQHSSAGKEPRPTHVAMNGKVFDLKQGMFDSDEGEWILPGQLINCRCTSRAIIPGFGE